MSPLPHGPPPRVVIIGGGFGGLSAARALKRAPVDITLLDKHNFHLFQPLLYQVATGGLSPANIASPLREILKHQQNTRVLLAEVVDIDTSKRIVKLSDGQVPYECLIVATGAGHNYFGHDQWEPFAPGLKTIEDATQIRRRILLAFEAAERESNPEKVSAWLTFVIVGSGPTGVELAGAVAEIARDTLKHNFRAINPADAHIILVEGMERALPSYPPMLSDQAAKALERLGVTIRTNAMVTDIQADSVTIRSQERTETLVAHTVLWTAGVRASPMGQVLARATRCALDKTGRVIVEPDLSLPKHPEIFVIGDLAHCALKDGAPLPGMAPVAIQQGRYVAQLVQGRLRHKRLPPFRYNDRGNMTTIGRASAVADLRWLRLWGFPAWLAWVFIHLLGLVEYQNRLLVFIQWTWNYFSHNRAARLITGESPLPLDRSHDPLRRPV